MITANRQNKQSIDIILDKVNTNILLSYLSKLIQKKLRKLERQTKKKKKV